MTYLFYNRKFGIYFIIGINVQQVTIVNNNKKTTYVNDLFMYCYTM